MTLKSLWYNIAMRFNKDGSPDKRFKNATENVQVAVETPQEQPIENVQVMGNQDIASVDPQSLLEKLLKENNLELDFDVVDGTIPTKFGFVKLEKPTLVVKATYVTSK